MTTLSELRRLNHDEGPRGIRGKTVFKKCAFIWSSEKKRVPGGTTIVPWGSDYLLDEEVWVFLTGPGRIFKRCVFAVRKKRKYNY